MLSDNKPGRWVVVVCLSALIFILYTRLTPFDFVWSSRLPLERLTWQPLTIRDAPLNVLLFIPFGFGLSGLLAGRREQSTLLFRVLAIGILLSIMLEGAQMFLPERVPSLADVLANAFGALLGYGLFRAWEMGFGRALDRYATRRNMLIGLAVYALGVALLTGYLRRSVSLSNWDTNFPLVVGNEAVGKRQWSGRVELLGLEVSRGSSLEFFANYDLSGEAPFNEKTQPPSSPSLEWRQGPTGDQIGPGVAVGPGEWLATASPMTRFSAAARSVDAFTIHLLAATADSKQRGPARIVSVSADAEQRNVTIGQEFDALIIRLRTPAGGENGQKPELLVPDVFADGRSRLVAVDYDTSTLRVRVDGEEYALSLAPGAAFFAGFKTENRWPVDMTGNPYRYDRAYWGIVIGLAALIFGGPAVAKQLVRK